MLVWHAHRELANAIGDTCTVTSVLISDGVRFSRSLRDDFLYRAMLNVYEDAIMETIKLPMPDASRVLEQLFPNSIVEREVVIGVIGWGARYGQHFISTDGTFSNQNIMKYLGFTAIKDPTRGRIPVPMKSGLEANALLNDHIDQKADPFVFLKVNDTNTEFHLYDMRSLLNNNDPIIVRYLPYPRHPENQAPTDSLMIDEIYAKRIISEAIVLAKMASQEIDDVQFISQELRR